MSSTQYYIIRNECTGRMFDMPDYKLAHRIKVNVSPKQVPPGVNQLWRFEPTNNQRSFVIVSVINPNFVLEVADKSTKPGTPVNLWVRGGKCLKANQLFYWNCKRLHSRLDPNLVLDVEYGNLVIEKKQKNKPTQRWTQTFDPNQKPKDTFYISNDAGGVLDIENGNNGKILFQNIVLKASCPKKTTTNTNIDQLWRIDKVEKEWFHIAASKNPNLVVDVEDDSPESGTSLIIYPKKSPPSEDQLFSWVDKNRLLSCMGTNMVIDIEQVNKTLILFLKDIGPNQGWCLVPCSTDQLPQELKNPGESIPPECPTDKTESPSSKGTDKDKDKDDDTEFKPIVNGCGNVMDLEASRTVPGIKILALPKQTPPGKTQLWRTQLVAEEWFNIVSSLDKNVVLEVLGNCAGAPIVSCTRKPNCKNQQF